VLLLHNRSQMSANPQVRVGENSEGFGGLLNPPFIEVSHSISIKPFAKSGSGGY